MTELVIGHVLEPMNTEQTYKWIITKIYESAMPECKKIEATTRMADGSIRQHADWMGRKFNAISYINIRPVMDDLFFIEDMPEGYGFFRMVTMNESKVPGEQLGLEIR